MEIYLVVECYQQRRFNIAAFYNFDDAVRYKRFLKQNVVKNINGVEYNIEKIIVVQGVM